jgi:hypothetical protein
MTIYNMSSEFIRSALLSKPNIYSFIVSQVVGGTPDCMQGIIKIPRGITAKIIRFQTFYGGSYPSAEITDPLGVYFHLIPRSWYDYMQENVLGDYDIVGAYWIDKVMEEWDTVFVGAWEHGPSEGWMEVDLSNYRFQTEACDILFYTDNQIDVAARRFAVQGMIEGVYPKGKDSIVKD